MSRACALAALLTALGAIVSLTASAQVPSPSDTRIAQGEVLFEAGNFDAALAEFEAAYVLLDGDAERYYILWNIGQCHERLFRYDRALEYYRRYLDEGGAEADDRATVEATMRALDGLLGTVRITTNVEHAELWVDDVQVGTAPGAIRVTGGRHTLELRAAGYLPARREVQIAARGERDEAIPLEPVPTESRIDPLFCILSGALAVASAGVGAGFWLYGQDQWNATLGLELGDGAQESIDQAALTGDVLFGAAALFAVTSVVLGFFTRWDGSPARDSDVAALVLPTPHGVALALGGRF